MDIGAWMDELEMETLIHVENWIATGENVMRYKNAPSDGTVYTCSDCGRESADYETRLIIEEGEEDSPICVDCLADILHPLDCGMEF